VSCCNCAVEQYTTLDKYIDSLSGGEGSLIPVLHYAQNLFGYLPPEVQQHIAKKMNISTARIYGVVTFYSFFTMEPRGQFNISVCLGTACFVRGSANILSEFEKQLNLKSGKMSDDGMFSLSSLRCVGACGLAPVVMVNDHVYGRVNTKDVKNIIKECMAKGGVQNEKDSITQ
jgi:NADH:ubiquinone oxidoreductase subunit E